MTTTETTRADPRAPREAEEQRGEGDDRAADGRRGGALRATPGAHGDREKERAEDEENPAERHRVREGSGASPERPFPLPQQVDRDAVRGTPVPETRSTAKSLSAIRLVARSEPIM